MNNIEDGWRREEFRKDYLGVHSRKKRFMMRQRAC